MDQAGIVPSLKLFRQLPAGGVKSTGPHIVKIVDEKLINTTNFETGKPVPTMRYFFEESGEKKQYDVEVKDKNDNLDYKIQKFAEFEKGTMLRLEGIRKGARNYIDIQLAEGEDTIPVIQEEKNSEGKTFEQQIEEA